MCVYLYLYLYLGFNWQGNLKVALTISQITNLIFLSDVSPDAHQVLPPPFLGALWFCLILNLTIRIWIRSSSVHSIVYAKLFVHGITATQLWWPICAKHDDISENTTKEKTGCKIFLCKVFKYISLGFFLCLNNLQPSLCHLCSVLVAGPNGTS